MCHHLKLKKSIVMSELIKDILVGIIIYNIGFYFGCRAGVKKMEKKIRKHNSFFSKF